MSVLSVLSVWRLKLTKLTILTMQKKCTGESGDIGDIAKNVNIAMQKIKVLNTYFFLNDKICKPLIYKRFGCTFLEKTYFYAV